MYDTLVLSGGAINGILELGSLQYCKDKGMIDGIKTYIGTSVGAIISYLMIIGYTPVEIIVYLCTHTKVFEKLKYFDINAGCRGDGATSFLHIIEYLEQMTTEKIGRLLTMKDIPILFGKKFICTTFNASKNASEILSDELTPDLPCLSAIRMSSNVPFVFEHYKYGDSFYVDGGVCKNFPIDIGEKDSESVLGIAVLLPKYKVDPNFYPQKNLLEYYIRLLFASHEEVTYSRIAMKKQNTTVIQLTSTGAKKSLEFSIDSKNKLELFSQGYTQTMTFFANQETESERIASGNASS